MNVSDILLSTSGPMERSILTQETLACVDLHCPVTLTSCPCGYAGLFNLQCPTVIWGSIPDLIELAMGGLQPLPLGQQCLNQVFFLDCSIFYFRDA